MPLISNNSRLAEIANRFSLSFKSQFDHHQPVYDKSVIFPIMNRFYQDYEEGLVLYGGQTATEMLYGYKKMRSATNDLDYVIREEKIGQLAVEYNLSYHTSYDILFTYIECIPITFTLDHIHQWQIAPDFFHNARVISFNETTTCSCSPEYSILLKLMRSYCSLKAEGKIFGKDGIDIVNMLTAPSFRPELLPVDLARLFTLVYENLTADFALISNIFSQVYKYHLHMDESGQQEFLKIYKELSEKLASYFKKDITRQ